MPRGGVWVRLIFCVLMGYAVGCVNPSYIFGKLRGIDIRNVGSGNAGAANAMLMVGKKAGVISALFDIFKAFAIFKIAELIYPELMIAGEVAGASCILGHIFPFYLRFSGGKGLACLGGMILAYDWRVFLVMLGAEIILLLIVDYICFVPVTAAIIFPIVYYILTRNLPGCAVLAVIGVIIILKHIENFRRIKEGSEAHFSMLWRRKEEEDRLRDKYE